MVMRNQSPPYYGGCVKMHSLTETTDVRYLLPCVFLILLLILLLIPSARSGNSHRLTETEVAIASWKGARTALSALPKWRRDTQARTRLSALLSRLNNGVGPRDRSALRPTSVAGVLRAAWP